MPNPKTPLRPHVVRLRLLKLFRVEHDEPAWPIVAGTMARFIAKRYESDYMRCLDVCQMLEADEAEVKESQNANAS